MARDDAMADARERQEFAALQGQAEELRLAVERIKGGDEAVLRVEASERGVGLGEPSCAIRPNGTADYVALRLALLEDCGDEADAAGIERSAIGLLPTLMCVACRRWAKPGTLPGTCPACGKRSLEAVELPERHFLVDGRAVSLTDLLADNADDADLCGWARSARPGDLFGGGAGGVCRCIVADPWAERRAFARSVAERIATAAVGFPTDADTARVAALLDGSVASSAIWRAMKANDTPAQAARRVLLAIGARVAP